MKTYGRLVLTQPGGREQEYRLTKAAVTLGRGAHNGVVLGDVKVSRTHARLECSDGGCVLVDLGSGNGTRVNGTRVERATLSPGDVVTIGGCTLRLLAEAPEGEVTVIDSPGDLEATLLHASVPMTLADTHTARLAVRTSGRTWEVALAGESLGIGRDSGSGLVVDHPKVSRQHARVERRGDGFVIRDLGSANGTWLGDRRVEEHALVDGDMIRVGDAQIVFKRAFDSEELTLAGEPAPVVKRERSPVIIVPGAMGSELWRGGERLWPDVKQLFTHPEVYRLRDDMPLEPRAVVKEVVVVPNLLELQQYSRLGDYLEEGLGYERGKDLFEFPYDWRQDNRVSARRLAAAIEGWKIDGPVTIIAHSMGCMVSRYYVERLGGKERVGRLIGMGGPHGGGPKMVAGLLYGRGFLPFGILGERMREALVSFPSVYQALPTYPCVFDQSGQAIDVLEDDTWLPEAHRPLLRAAREFRRELGTRSSVPFTSVFGYGMKTITRAVVQRDSQGRWQKADFITEPGGDNMFPELSAVVDGSEIHPVQQHHGSLYVDNDVKMRLKLELVTRRGAGRS